MKFSLLIDANDWHCVMIGCVVDTDVDWIVVVVDVDLIVVVVDVDLIVAVVDVDIVVDWDVEDVDCSRNILL